MQKGTQLYAQTAIGTAGQGEILVMLYNGAIKFLTLAKVKIQEKDIAAKGNLISRALDIINELDSSINMSAGGSLSQNLHQLYFVSSTRLVKANLHNDIAAIDGVIRTLTTLRDAYKSIIGTPEARAASSQIANKLGASGKLTAPKRATLAPAPAPTFGAARQGYGQAAAAAQTPAFPEPAAPPQTQAAPLPSSAPVFPAPEPAAPAAPLPGAPAAAEAPAVPASLDSRRQAAAARYGKIARTM